MGPAHSTRTEAAVEPGLLQTFEEHAVRFARETGELLLGYFQSQLKVEYKSEGYQDPVSEADRAAEALLIERIGASFPDHGILSEETPESQGLDRDFLWVLDPLDGTTNFVNRFPLFGVSVGLLYRGTPVVGALFVPTPATQGGQVIHARQGGGAFADDSPVAVYEGDAPSAGGLSAMPGHFWSQFRVGNALRRKTGETRVTGSIAYELVLVASGVLEYAAFGGPKIWDVAAGVIIIREARGDVLVRTNRRRWEPFRSFLEPGAGIPADGDLRNWGAGLVVGNASLAGFVTSNLRPRAGLWRWLRRLGLRRPG